MLVLTFIIDILVNSFVMVADLRVTGVSRIIRTARFCRILRTLRLVRVSSYAREFRKMAYALQHSVLTLFWAILLLTFILYCFATTFTQAVADFRFEDTPARNMTAELTEELHNYYGTLPRSFYTLYMALTTGINWDLAVQPLSQIHWSLVGLFLFFISITLTGVMNVLTSIFVDSALQSTEHYKDIKIQEALNSKRTHVRHLKEVFKEIDIDMSGEICADELLWLLKDPNLSKYLTSIDIHTDDIEMLFRLLDGDGSGQVSIEEFCDGCLRLKGEAKSFDIHCMLYQNERLLHKLTDFMAVTNETITNMETSICKLSKRGSLAPIQELQPDQIEAPPPCHRGPLLCLGPRAANMYEAQI